MTFAELQTEFYSRGFNYLSDDSAGQTRAKRWINQGYLKLCWEEDWYFTKATATGTAPLAVTDLGSVLEVDDTTNDVQLHGMEERALSDLDTDLARAGQPQFWYRDNNTIRVYPVTAVSLRVRYHKIPVELSGSTDEPIVPVRYQDLIVDAAALKGYKDNENWNNYNGLKAIYDSDLQAMRQNLLRTELDGTERVRIVRGSDEWGY